MKQISIMALILAFTFTALSPQFALAKKGGDDDRDRYEYEDRDYKYEDDNDDDDRDDELEVEADVYSDITIVKVELSNGKKTVFKTAADTRAEVVNEVADRFGISKAEVEAVLEFEIEDRASRTNERAKISNMNNRPVKVCEDDSSNKLEVEADVFTNTTIVKVEKGDIKTVFETAATSSNDIASAVVSRISGVTLSEVKAVLDVDIEDRVSKASDFVISTSTNDDCKDRNQSSVKGNTSTDAKLEARIAELQKLIEALMRLLTARQGN